ncbi:MAG: hypothetical protein M1133_09095 [Armatimonadetes bacterium]|nr:hypothetical protein [Armatimonadota bacterium]
MVADWSKQESQLGLLTTQAQRYVTTFRWLFMVNLAAAVIGVATRHYELMVVAAGSSLIALIGVAFARMGRKTVSEATWESKRIRHKLELP